MWTYCAPLHAEPKAVVETGLEAVTAGRITVDTIAQALAQFETIGTPAHNLAFRPHREYPHDLHDLLSYLTREGQAVWSFA